MQTIVSNKMSHNEKTSFSWRQNSNRKSARNRHVRSCTFRIPWQSEFSPIELVKDLAERVTNALRLVSRRRSLNRDSSSLGRSASAGSSAASHRTAAVEDCIEFIHSSFSRSNSSTKTSHEDSIEAAWDTYDHRINDKGVCLLYINRISLYFFFSLLGFF